jgi:type IV pilus assembly protein PilN
MEAMETVLPAGVQVTSIEPIRAPDGHITVHVRVVGPRDRADDLVANLEHSRRFLLPRITGENAESSNNPSQRQEPISISNRFDFELLADYNPPTPEEERIAARPVHKRLFDHSPRLPQAARQRRPSYTGPSASGSNSLSHNPTRGGPQ